MGIYNFTIYDFFMGLMGPMGYYRDGAVNRDALDEEHGAN